MQIKNLFNSSISMKGYNRQTYSNGGATFDISWPSNGLKRPEFGDVSGKLEYKMLNNDVFEGELERNARKNYTNRLDNLFEYEIQENKKEAEKHFYEKEANVDGKLISACFNEKYLGLDDQIYTCLESTDKSGSKMTIELNRFGTNKLIVMFEDSSKAEDENLKSVVLDLYEEEIITDLNPDEIAELKEKAYKLIDDAKSIDAKVPYEKLEEFLKAFDCAIQGKRFY